MISTSWKHSKYATSGLCPFFTSNVEGALHEGADTAAEHGLFAEDVAHGLLAKARFESAGPETAEPPSDGERDSLRVPRRVVSDADEARKTDSVEVRFAEPPSLPFRGDEEVIESP